MIERISVIYGKDIERMTKVLLDTDNTASRIKSKDATIVIKPNLVTLSDPSEGATTHIEIVETVIGYLKEHGFSNITIAEGSWVGASTEKCFEKLGYYRLRDQYGVGLVDTKKDKFRKVEPEGIAMEVSETFLNADFFVNIPVLKGHCQTLMTHAMKNLKGCISDKSKRDFHKLGLDKPIAALSTILHPDLVISDGICGDLDFEEGGNPVETDRMMAARNGVILDIYSASLMGYDIEEIGYLREARKMGLFDSAEWEIKELSKPVTHSKVPSRAVKRLETYTAADEACSACYASLIRALKIFIEEGGNPPRTKIAIGQGYRGKHTPIGVGSCCSKADVNAPGCPARTDEILSMLRGLR